MSTTHLQQTEFPQTRRINHPPPLEGTVQSEFQEQAGRRQAGLFGELVHMLLRSKKWWLLPILAVLSVIGAIVILGGSAAAPFIYTLF